jgi:localization factor PodJL
MAAAQAATEALMNTRRSFLDSMNEGRQRRATTSIEQLNRTLDELENRIGRARDQDPAFEPQAPAAYRELRDQPAPARGERMVDRLADELALLRRELGQQMSAGLRQEFADLRAGIAEALQASQPSHQLSALAHEFDRLATSIEQSGPRGDDRQVNMLRLELEEVKRGLGEVAREETVQAARERWDELDRLWRERGEAGGAASLPLERIIERIEALGSRIDQLPDAETLRGMEDKIRVLAGAVDQFAQQRADIGPDILDAIDARLGEIATAISASASPAPASYDTEPLERIEARIAALAKQMTELAEASPAAGMEHHFAALGARIEDMAGRIELPATLLQRLSDQMAAFEKGPGLDASDPAVARLTARLEAISERLEASTALSGGGGEPEFVQRLESQFAALSRHFAEPAAQEISPRLERIEEAIARGQAGIIEAARKAAEEAVSTYAGPDAERSVMAALAGDLKSLEALTRRADDRNSRTFEAIHDTLVKIVERLGAFETARAMPEPATRPVTAAELVPQPAMALDPAATPSIEPDYDGMSLDDLDDGRPDDARTPQIAAREAAAEAQREEPVQTPQEEPGQRSLFGKLGRALTARRAKPADSRTEPPAPLPSASTPTLAGEPTPEIDPEIANQPLEPGSGTPDLQAIMRRVRDERSRSAVSSGPDAAKSDFIAAARRAAQAAAAEAEMMKKSPSRKGKDGGLSFGRLLRGRGKPVMLGVAAVLFAIAGLQGGRMYLAGGDGIAADAPQQVAAAAPVPLPAEPAKAAAPVAAKAEARDVDEATVATVRRVDEPAKGAAASVMRKPASAADMSDDWLELEPSSAAAPAASAAAQEPAPAAAPMKTAAVEAPAKALPSPATSAEAPSGAADIAIPVVEVGPIALRQAAEEGDPKALFEVADRYAEGRGAKQDMAKAAEWYERSAELGFAPAQYRIGNYLEKGVGVERDLARATEWYELAAEGGNAAAMHNLAVLYAMGADGEPRHTEAARWFVEAAELGITDSQFNAGILAAKGVGMKQDLVEAYKWFALVADSGDRDAAAKRDEIANAMQPDQLERARATTALWKARPVDDEANNVDIPDEWSDTETTASIDAQGAIRNVQAILSANGYDAGTPDGVIGGRTRSAILAFQKDNGLAETGDVTEELVRALLAKR